MASPKITGNSGMKKMSGVGSKKKRRMRKAKPSDAERAASAKRKYRSGRYSPDLGERIFKRRRPTRG